MATHESICKFNQSGFCKYKEHCRKQHVMDVCPTSMCNNMSCLLRHPKVCKFFLSFMRCKFGEACAFLHGPDKQTDAENISELEQEIQHVKAKISEVETILSKLDKIEERMMSVEKRNLKTCEEIKEVMKTLNQKTSQMEKVQKTLDPKTSQIEEAQKTLDEKPSQLDDLALNFNILMNSVDDLEKSSAHFNHRLNHLSETIQMFRCNLCGQAYPNEQTLRNHIQRNHGPSKT